MEKELTREETEWFESLYCEMFSKLLTLARYTFGQDSPLAEEVVQDTFLTLYLKLDEIREHENPNAWLIVALKNKSANVLRKCDHMNKLVVTFMSQDKSDYIVSQQQLETDLMYSDLIGDEDYQLLKMVYVYGCTMKDAAEEFGITLAACKKRVQRTRAKLKKILEDIEKNYSA